MWMWLGQVKSSLIWSVANMAIGDPDPPGTGARVGVGAAAATAAGQRQRETLLQTET